MGTGDGASSVSDRIDSEKSSRSRFGAIADVIDDGLFSLDGDARIVSVNDAIVQTTGFDRGDLVGSHVSALVGDVDAGRVERELDRLRGTPGERGTLLDVSIVTASNDRLTWELRVSSIEESAGDDEHEPMAGESMAGESATGESMADESMMGESATDDAAFVVVAREISTTRSRVTEQALYETIVEAVEDGVYVVDEDARFTMVNDAYVEMTGYDRDELVGADVSLVVDEDIAAAARERVSELERDVDADPVLEAEIETKDGRRLPVEGSFAILPGDDERYHRVGVVRDVTSRKMTERALRTYKQIVETIEEGIYVKDPDGYFTMVNDAYAALTGYDRDELVGSHASLVVDEDVIEESRDVLDSKSEDVESVENLEAMLETADGDRVPSEASFSTLETVDDEELEIGVVRDISERRAQRRRIEESERRYRTLAENFPEGAVGLFDEEFRYTAVGGELLELTGTEPEERIGESVFDLYPPDIVAKVDQHFEAALNGEKRTFEVQYRGRDLLCHTLPVGGDDEVFAGMLVVQDISERRERERELEAERERLRAVNNLHQVALEVNQALARQRSREEIEAVVCEHIASAESYAFGWVGSLERDTDGGTGARVVPSATTDESMRVDSFVVDLDGDVETMGPDARAMATGEVQVSMDVSDAPADGCWRMHADELDVRAAASVPVSFEDRPFGVLNVYTSREDAFDDVERRVLEQLGEIMGLALAAADRAEALAYERERFELLNRLIRHNLLNSLNVVGARLSILEGHVDDAVIPHLETVLDRVDEMTGLVETIRHLMLVITEESHELEPVSLGSVVAETVEGARAAYPEASIEVEGDVEDLGAVLADDLLGEVLENLLANAVQHNDAASPRVRVSVDGGGEVATVRVADNGPGVPDEMRERLFEMGEQAFDSPGTGFGLYLVREIVHAYGGEVSIGESDMGGALFEVEIPTPEA